MHDNTITLFNYREAEGLWYTTVFSNVTLTELKAEGASQYGHTNSDTVEIIIKVRPNKVASTLIYEPNSIVDGDGNVIVSDEGTRVAYQDPDTKEERQYIGPKAYAALETPTGYFTFKPECDFIMVGNYSHAEPIADDEFEQGLYHAMNEAQDGVYMVTSAAYFSLLPHFEIGGR